MTRLNIHEAKTHLSRYLAELGEDEVITLCNRNVPVAEIRALPKQLSEKRTIGFLKDEFSVPPSFFEPLPEEMLDAFEGIGNLRTQP